MTEPQQDSTRDEDVRLAHQVLAGNHAGSLATFSVKYPQYPFCSLVPYALDRNGFPVLLLSRLAQHTQNLLNNPHLSLLIMEPTDADVQTEARLTLLGQAEAVEPVDEVAERFFRYFPQMREYHEQLDFDFYRVCPEKVRSIAGFGRARWLSGADAICPNPLTSEEEMRIINHMNQDHSDALKGYLSGLPRLEFFNEQPVMVGIDRFGLDCRCGSRLVRVPFKRTVSDVKQVRELLVEMVQGAPTS